MKSKAIYYLLLGGMLFGFGSCMRDDLDAEAEPIGKGESRVSFAVTFQALSNLSLGKTRSLKGDQIAEIEDQTYTGRAVRPGVTIQYQGKTLTEAKDYALIYKKNKKIGKASVTIKGIGEYEGSKTMTFYIAPRPPRIKKAVSDSRKKVSLRWSKKKQADGYQIKIARDKQFTRKVKTVNIKKNTKVKKTVKVKGKGRAKYYVRIRSYKIIDGKKHYGKFGYKKAVRIK